MCPSDGSHPEIGLLVSGNKIKPKIAGADDSLRSRKNAPFLLAQSILMVIDHL